MSEFDTTASIHDDYDLTTTAPLDGGITASDIANAPLNRRPNPPQGTFVGGDGRLHSNTTEHTKDFYNASGCADPAAYWASCNADQEYRRFQDLLHTIWSVCKVAGFHVEGHITLVDKRTGRVWK